MAPKLLKREILYKSKYTELRKDNIELEDGLQTVREVIERPSAVVVVAVDNYDEYYFVRQHRWAVGENLLELPAGKIEDGQTPLECAQMELQQEIKMGGYFHPLGQFYASPGYSTELLHVFEATSLVPSALDGDEDERIEIEVLTYVEVINAIKNGQIKDSKSISALWLHFLKTDVRFAGR